MKKKNKSLTTVFSCLTSELEAQPKPKPRQKNHTARFYLKGNKIKKEIYIRNVPQQYRVYIVGRFWKMRKNRFFQKYGRRCDVCNSKGIIQLHHKFYGNYGNEKDSDLVALCGFHHTQLHLGIGRTQKDMRVITDKLILEMKKTPFEYRPLIHT